MVMPSMARLFITSSTSPTNSGLLCSTARRARETWELIAAEAPAVPPATFVERLYDASPRTLLDVFRHAEPEAKSLLVVGHNPGLQEVATQLIASGDL